MFFSSLKAETYGNMWHKDSYRRPSSPCTCWVEGQDSMQETGIFLLKVYKSLCGSLMKSLQQSTGPSVPNNYFCIKWKTMKEAGFVDGFSGEWIKETQGHFVSFTLESYDLHKHGYYGHVCLITLPQSCLLHHGKQSSCSSLSAACHKKTWQA